MLPSGPGSAPITAPHFSPAGSCAQFASRRYGLGRSLIGVALCHLGAGCATTLAKRNAETATNAENILALRILPPLRSIAFVYVTAGAAWPGTPWMPLRP